MTRYIEATEPYTLPTWELERGSVVRGPSGHPHTVSDIRAGQAVGTTAIRWAHTPRRWSAYPSNQLFLYLGRVVAERSRS